MYKITLATRFTIASSLISCVLFCIIGWMSYKNVEYMMHKQQDKGLLARIQRMQVFLTNENTIDILVKYPKLYENMSGQEDNLFIVKRNDQFLININPLDIQIPSLNYKKEAQFINNDAQKPTTRLAYQKVELVNQPFEIIAGRQWKDVNLVLRNYLWKVVFYGALGIALSSISGFLLGHYLFRSMRNLIIETKKIDVHKLYDRINVSQNSVEVRQLSSAMNEMLDKIQANYEQLSRFSEDIAHELRTPLNNLIGQTQIILSKKRDQDELENLLYSHLDEYERMTKMIESMLFIARSEHSEYPLGKSMVYLSSVVSEIAEYFTYLTDEKEMIFTHDISHELFIIGDRELVKRAIANLISNAILHGPNHGKITITAKRNESNCEIAVLTHNVFLNANHLPHLFERFYQIDSSRHKKAQTGGLGLSIVQSIMQLHGGQSTAHNTTHGISFKLTFPLS